MSNTSTAPPAAPAPSSPSPAPKGGGEAPPEGARAVAAKPGDVALAETSSETRARQMQHAAEAMGDRFNLHEERDRARRGDFSGRGEDTANQLLANLYGEQIGGKEPGVPAGEAPPEAEASTTETPEEPTEAQGPGDGVQAEPGSSVPADQGEDYAKAVLGLRYAKVPQNVVESLSVDQIIEWGLQEHAAHAARSQAIDNKAGEEAKSEGGTGAKPEAQVEATEPTPAVSGEALKAFNAELLELGVTPEAVSELPSTIMGMVETRANALVQEAVSPLVNELRFSREQLGTLLEAKARQDLETIYPVLEDDGNWADVREDLLRLGETGDLRAFSNLGEAYEHVAYLRHGRATLQDAQVRTEQELKRRENAAPMTTRGPKPQNGMTFDQWQTEVANASIGGKRERLAELRRVRPA